ncbi:MAG: helix-turn-helix domain-containing protein [Nocardioides sp.]
MITLEDWALIRRLAADGVPKARIAARLGISRTTVIKAVNSDAPPRYVRSPGPTSFTEFELNRPGESGGWVWWLSRLA